MTARTCAACSHARRPLPADWTTLDFFDRAVVAQEAVFRTTCTVVPDAEKPCLQPAPATPSLADFTDWLNRAQAHALDGMNATTGETFTVHLDAFTQASTTINVLAQFNSAQPSTTQTSGEAA